MIAFLGYLTAIHGEASGALADAHLRGLQILDGGDDRLDHPATQLVRVGQDLLGLVRRQVVHVDEVVAHHGAAVRVRATQHDLLALQARLLHHRGTDRLGDGTRNADTNR